MISHAPSTAHTPPRTVLTYVGNREYFWIKYIGDLDTFSFSLSIVYRKARAFRRRRREIFCGSLYCVFRFWFIVVPRNSGDEKGRVAVDLFKVFPWKIELCELIEECFLEIVPAILRSREDSP